MTSRRNIMAVFFLLNFFLAGCSSQAIATEVYSTPINNKPKSTEVELTAISSVDNVCPPFYQKPNNVLTLNLPSDLYGLVPGDYNDDGFMDVLLYRGFTLTRNSASLEILENDGHGNLSLKTENIFDGFAPSTVVAREIVLADFNGDGRTDIFIADHGMDAPPNPGAQNSLVLSAPGGKLVDATDRLPQVIDYTHSAAAADIDGDGDIDIYSGNVWGEKNIPPMILLNSDSAGTFIKVNGRLPYPLGDLDFGGFTTSEFADVNNDSFPDLILIDAGDDLEGGTESHVLLNNGSGYFSYLPKAIPPKPWSESDSPVDIDSSDINQDGYLDLLILFTNQEYRGRIIQVLINNQDGTFSDETESRLPQTNNNLPWLSWIQLVDLNKDGSLDIATFPSIGNKDPKFYLNDGKGYFRNISNPFNFNAGLYTFLDINQDGNLDVLWTATYPDETYYINLSLGCTNLEK